MISYNSPPVFLGRKSLTVRTNSDFYSLTLVLAVLIGNCHPHLIRSQKVTKEHALNKNHENYDGMSHAS